ncbi:hypothetical protein E1B28_004058 [Marasmius oreades]|uniref:Uncharacterized protein n=1 Tax=Marasmius oreades TaxID=181124 RepID=A0A9P8ACA6_9AGAR|nr:uncharacterized protein E1B28_004058 [Marasmius oreades]KAG7096642.1 hypothetical protein E1B28_004058 [Marasmius oreades]
MPSLFPNEYPSLPQFSSLLVKGSHHPTAPLHLALSHLALSSESTALILSSSSIHLNLALRQYNDDWLATHSGHGDLAAVSSRVQIFYPPTPAHLVFLLSTFHVVDSSANSDDLASSKSVLACPPALIVLHELSSYFLRDVQEHPTSHSWTVSSYLNLVAQTASLISFLSPTKAGSTPSTVLALFDSRIDEMKLPVLRHPSSGNERPSIAAPDLARSPRVEEVAPLVQNYFQWTAVFSSG